MWSHLKIENKLEEKWKVPNIEELTSLLGSKVVKLPFSYIFLYFILFFIFLFFLFFFEEPSKPLGLSIETQTLGLP